jgi:serine phosphatase RsbU (regulator of sigma subunit)
MLYWLLAATIAALIWLALGSLSSKRRKLGQTLRLTGALFLAACAASALAAGQHALGPAQITLVYWAVTPILFTLYFYLYSEKRFVTRAIRWLTVLLVISLIGQLFGTVGTNKSANSPYLTHIPHLALNAFALTGDTLQAALLIVGLVPQLYARRRYLVDSAPAAPIPWRALGAAVGSGVLLVALGAAVFTRPFGAQQGVPLLAHAALYLVTVLVPAALAFGALSVRPLDRQALMLRAAYYAALTLVLVAAYAATCVLLLALFVPLEDRGGLQIAVLAGAVVTAGVFRPLARWLWPPAERVLAPEAHRARAALTRVGTGAFSEVQLEPLCEWLAGAVAQALQPAGVVLWVRSAPTLSAQAVERLMPRREQDAAVARSSLGARTVELQERCRVGAVASAPPGGTLLVAGDDPLWATLPAQSTTVPLGQLPLESRAAHALEAAGAELVLPLVSESELIAVLALGPRHDKVAYSYDECLVLDELAGAVAPALRVALVVHEQDTQLRTRERVEQELRTARRIQQTLLPKEVPQLAGWQIDVYYEPAREVGGDFYDFLRFGDGRLGIVLGDVTDKGVPAALVMATTRSMLRAAAQETTPPGAVLARVNDLLYTDLPANMFVTCFYGILDPTSGRLHFANAGQDLPCLRSADAHVGEARATGMPLGLMPDMTYDENEVTLARADSVLFYSDGLVEAHNARREMFDTPRLTAYLSRDVPADGQIAGLLRELAGFTGPGWEQEDDITLVALRRV